MANHPGSGAKLHAKAKFACKNGRISAKPLMAVKRLAAGGAKKCQKVPVLQAGSASPFRMPISGNKAPHCLRHRFGSYLDTKFCPQNKQTSRSARKYCEGRYQFRNHLWITPSSPGLTHGPTRPETPPLNQPASKTRKNLLQIIYTRRQKSLIPAKTAQRTLLQNHSSSPSNKPHTKSCPACYIYPYRPNEFAISAKSSSQPS